VASAITGAATLVFAQARPARPAHPAAAAPKGAPPSADSPYEDRGAPSPARPAPTPPGSAASAAAADGGPSPPPPPAVESADGGALSPLNPAANEFSDAGAPPMSIDYDRLLADIAALRARVAAVSDTLFHSRVAVAIETSGDHGRIASLAVSLDDGIVWTSPATFRAEDATTVYDHAVAPGHHALGVEVERRDDRNDVFRTVQRSRFVIDVPADQRLAVELKLWDDSDMGADFPSDKSGKYELRVRMKAKAQPLSSR
jgi:hypothetical protein